MMKKILFYLTTLSLLISCKKKDETVPEYKTSVTINGTTWVTNNTTPQTSGQFATLYYYPSDHKLTYSIINADSGDKIILVIKATNSISNTTYTFDGTDYSASYYLKDEAKLMGKSVTGSIHINSLSIVDNKIANLDADFSFTQTSKDVDGTAYNHKVENAHIKNMKQSN